jgi:hypothetical protein
VTKARSVARLIAERILADGGIAGAPQHAGSSSEGMRFAVDHGKVDEYGRTEPFAELQVISIVYTDGMREDEAGRHVEPEVTIYIPNVRKFTNAFIASLPKVIDGVKVSVEKSTLVGVDEKEVETFAPNSRTYLRNGRIACGSSCAPARGFPGTIGAVVKLDGKDKVDDGTRFILSCNHVLAACSQIGIGMPILSPAANDAKTSGPVPLAIARLHEAVELRQGHWSHGSICEIDAAIGILLNSNYVTSWQGDEIGYETPTEIVDPEGRMQVKKFGRSSGLTHGVISGRVESHWSVPYDTREYKAMLWFKNHSMIVATRIPFALPGDSGSLVVTEDGTAAVGLLFSTNATGNNAYIIPIRQVLKALKVSLVSEH